MATSKTSLVSAGEVNSRGEIDQLPSLFGKLGDDVMQLFNSQLALFRVELKEEANAYARGAVMIAVAACIVAVGFALVNIAVALGVSTLFAQAQFSQPVSYALGFVSTGAFYLIVGAIVLSVVKNRLAKQPVVPQRTVTELRKDKEWLKNEI